MTPPSALLLDLDGTLLDHDHAARTALGQAMQGAGLTDADHSSALLLWRELERIHFQEYLDGQTTFEEQRHRRVRAFLAHYDRTRLDRTSALVWFDTYRTAYERAWRAFEDVAPLLEGLAQLAPRPAVAVVTNGDEEQQHAKLTAIGLSQLPLFASSSMGARKPDPRVFHDVCAALEVSPDAAWFIGDNLEVDAQGASAAGLCGIWLNRDGSTDQRAEPPRASSLIEVLEWARAGSDAIG
ncbi:HAD family hydrolase [Micrococcus yunnanensis]|uniref:HAD family hydrolase n=1 Tax=Micrococcus yunnanensis TaxID=566027 RepID=A0AAP5T8U4_9MICC|nr:HAD family hydrolase [Micrococcus yunnanensis]MDV7178207.1 HAD family hydrolase [Micrococcus yunnanensis]